MKSVILAVALWIQCTLGIGPFESWITSPVTLPANAYYGFAVYAEESSFSECIFVFGGVNCLTCMSCYNITSNTIYTYDTLTTGGYRIGDPAAVLIVDEDSGEELIYFLTHDGYLQKYDLNTKTESNKLFSTDVDEACLVKNKNGTELYIVEGAGSLFWIYDLIDSELVVGPSLSFSRTDHSCAVNEWDEDDPYLYVLGGNRVQIERIKINGLLADIETNTNEYEWETLMLQLTSNIDHRITFAYQSSCRLMSSVSYVNYIYLIGGYDGSAEADIIYLDVENWELKYVGEYLAAYYGMASVVAHDRIYTFGGATTNLIAFTNTAPSLEPTVSPTSPPSNLPSDSPSSYPTSSPSDSTQSPSNSPTITEQPVADDTTQTPQDPTTTSATTTTSVTTTTVIITTESPETTDNGVERITSTTSNPTNSPTSAPNDSGSSGAGSNSDSGISSSSEVLSVTMIIFFIIGGICCCCVGCCGMAYMIHSKFWAPYKRDRDTRLQMQAQAQYLMKMPGHPGSGVSVEAGDIIRVNSNSMGARGLGVEQYFATDTAARFGESGAARQANVVYIDGQPVRIRDPVNTGDALVVAAGGDGNGDINSGVNDGNIGYLLRNSDGSYQRINGNRNVARRGRGGGQVAPGVVNLQAQPQVQQRYVVKKQGNRGGAGDQLEIEMKPVAGGGSGGVRDNQQVGSMNQVDVNDIMKVMAQTPNDLFESDDEADKANLNHDGALLAAAKGGSTNIAQKAGEQMGNGL